MGYYEGSERKRTHLSRHTKREAKLFLSVYSDLRTILDEASVDN